MTETNTTRAGEGGNRGLWLILAIIAVVAIVGLVFFMNNNGADEGEALEGATTEVTTNIDTAPAENAAAATGQALENAAEATGNAAQNAAQATGDAAQNAGAAVSGAAENATDGDPDSNNNEPNR